MPSRIFIMVSVCNVCILLTLQIVLQEMARQKLVLVALGQFLNRNGAEAHLEQNNRRELEQAKN